MGSAGRVAAVIMVAPLPIPFAVSTGELGPTIGVVPTFAPQSLNSAMSGSNTEAIGERFAPVTTTLAARASTDALPNADVVVGGGADASERLANVVRLAGRLHARIVRPVDFRSVKQRRRSSHCRPTSEDVVGLRGFLERDYLRTDRDEQAFSIDMTADAVRFHGHGVVPRSRAVRDKRRSVVRRPKIDDALELRSVAVRCIADGTTLTRLMLNHALAGNLRRLTGIAGVELEIRRRRRALRDRRDARRDTSSGLARSCPEVWCR